MPVLPNLFIIGTQKGGSTTLFHHLSQHRDIATFREKEINLFLEGVDIDVRLRDLGNPVGGDKYVLDGSINYSRYPRHAGVPERILQSVGQETPRFIYTLRNPIDRLLSHYYWNSQRYGEPRNILAAAAHDNLYVVTGQYERQLQQYLQYFSLSQFCFVKFEDLCRDPEAETNRVLDWLGLGPMSIDSKVRMASTHAKTTRELRFPRLHAFVLEFPLLKGVLQKALSDRALRLLHKKLSREVRREPVGKELRQKLLDQYFRDSIEATERMLELDLSDWKVP